MYTYEVNHIYVNGSLAYVSLSGEGAHAFSVAEKAKGNETVFKSYVTTQSFTEAVSDSIDNQ